MDTQYKAFREGLVAFFTVAVVFSGGRRLLTAAMANASARVLPVNWRMGWYCNFSVVFIVIMRCTCFGSCPLITCFPAHARCKGATGVRR